MFCSVLSANYLATETAAVKPRRSFSRLLIVYVVLPASVAYGAGTYYAITSSNDKFHSFWVERVPFTEPIVEYFEREKVGQMVDGLVKKPVTSTRDQAQTIERKVVSLEEQEAARRKREEQDRKVREDKERQAKRKAEQAAAAVKAEAQKALETEEELRKRAVEKIESVGATVKTQATKAKDAVKSVIPQKAVQTTASAATTIPASVSDVASNGSQAVKDDLSDLVHKAEEVIDDFKAPEVQPTAAPQGVRKDVDGHPLPSRKGPAKEPYRAAIPIGYEAPPGYAGFVPKRDVSASPDAPKTEVPKLPLIAPEIQGIAVSEPLVGQIASTIDNLTNFLNSNPVHSSSVVGVVEAARNDLKNLTERMERIKKEESEKLEKQLESQAAQYSDMLAKQEMSAIEGLDKMEEGWKNAFDQEREVMLNSYRTKLEAELDVQKQIINERLKEEIVSKGIELQRRWLREIKVKVEQERGGKLSKLKELQVGLKNLENLTLENSQALNQNMVAQKIWTSVRNVLVAALEGGVQRPFEQELQSDSDASTSSSRTEDLISLSVSSIPSTVQTRGLTPFPDLVSRFTHSLSPAIRRAALFPTDGGLVSYLTSVTLSPLLFKKEGYTEGEDVSARLARAEWHLVRRDLASAVREVNGLQGWPKVLAHDWLNEARRHLEVKQALEVAQTEAELAQLLVL
ncbi:hypothetical protein BT69DRAFT_1307891 [Atractiella rhizophila]|nr:hypothetical protein BT69DRAFT_1307891 [Atractiella rhizophila]